MRRPADNGSATNRVRLSTRRGPRADGGHGLFLGRGTENLNQYAFLRGCTSQGSTPISSSEIVIVLSGYVVRVQRFDYMRETSSSSTKV